MDKRFIYHAVGRIIKQCREGADKTQVQLAAQIGISRSSLANIEAGRQQVLVHHLYKIADALDLDSPTVLMVRVPKTHCSDDSDIMPFSQELSDKQQRDIQRMMLREE